MEEITLTCTIHTNPVYSQKIIFFQSMFLAFAEYNCLIV